MGALFFRAARSAAGPLLARGSARLELGDDKIYTLLLLRRRRPGAQRRAEGARRRLPRGSRGGGAPLGSRGLDHARLCASSGSRASGALARRRASGCCSSSFFGRRRLSLSLDPERLARAAPPAAAGAATVPAPLLDHRLKGHVPLAGCALPLVGALERAPLPEPPLRAPHDPRRCSCGAATAHGSPDRRRRTRAPVRSGDASVRPTVAPVAHRRARTAAVPRHSASATECHCRSLPGEPRPPPTSERRGRARFPSRLGRRATPTTIRSSRPRPSRFPRRLPSRRR